MREKLVGPANESNIFIHNVQANALIDSGSMVTTVSQSFYMSLPCRPPLLSLDDFGINVSIADGSTLNVLGYIETNISLPFLTEINLDVPVLVVPDSSINSLCPCIVGTNVIRRFKAAAKEIVLPDSWQIAFDSITCKPCTVRSTNKHKVEVGPYESVTLTGIVRGVSHDIETVITENFDSDHPYIVRPHVVGLPQQGTYARVPVKLCNISAKSIFIKPKSDLCYINEVKVVDNLSSHIDTFEKQNDTPDAEELGLKIDKSNLTPEQLLRLRQVLGNWNHIFSKGLTDLGCTDAVKHKIILTDDKPFKQPYRKIPPGMYEEVRQHLKDMLECGAIRPSESPYSSNVVLVRKKDNSLRFCLDYRMLNARTRKDAYMLPRFDDSIDVLSGAKYFSKLDLRSAYWQVEIEEEDKQKTAFSVGNLGFYEANRLSYGMCNAPAVFQRLMERCMGDLHLRDCLVFIDDILIFSQTFEEHIERLEGVFSRLGKYGLKLKPSKCELFKTSVEYLGHIISEEGISTDPAKTKAVSEWKTPTNIKELRSFLGFAGYYRRFVKNYSSIVKPLNSLLEGHCTVKKFKKNKKKKLPVLWTWGAEQQQAFEVIKQKLTQAPVLGIADYSLPFTVHTDASCTGLGAVLVQDQDGHERVIAYASRGLRPAERNYPVHKLEFLALKWAVTDKFHDYLYGNTFVVMTDNNPLTYVLSTAKLDAAQHRWVADLANYNFSLQYKTGKTNCDADGLSRNPVNLFTDAI